MLALPQIIFFELLKPRVMSLVIFTAFIGLVVAPVSVHPVMAFAGLLFIAIGAGASAALNMWYDADIDAQMTRTALRPIPSGRIDKSTSLAFWFMVGWHFGFCLGVFINWTAAALLAFTIFFYAVVYTIWLKRKDCPKYCDWRQGRFRQMIGWAVATGEIGLYSIAFRHYLSGRRLHFWALAL